MKRDKKLIRKILEYVRDNDETTTTLHPSDFEDYSKPTIEYHVDLCEQAGFLKGPEDFHGGNVFTRPLTLTWEGHNAIEQWTGC